MLSIDPRQGYSGQAAIVRPIHGAKSTVHTRVATVNNTVVTVTWPAGSNISELEIYGIRRGVSIGSHAAWTGIHTYYPGDIVKASNMLFMCMGATTGVGGALSGASAPTWNTTYHQYTSDGPSLSWSPIKPDEIPVYGAFAIDAPSDAVATDWLANPFQDSLNSDKFCEIVPVETIVNIPLSGPMVNGGGGGRLDIATVSLAGGANPPAVTWVIKGS